jgi:hypothetical protein
MDGNFEPLPEGEYDFEIVDYKELKTKNDDPMVNIECHVIDSIQHSGRKVWNNVTFFPPGAKAAGIAIHFLKCIGESWEGAFNWDPDNWVGRKFRGSVEINRYTDKSGQIKVNNKIARVQTYQGAVSSDGNADPGEEVPF